MMKEAVDAIIYQLLSTREDLRIEDVTRIMEISEKDLKQ